MSYSVDVKRIEKDLFALSKIGYNQEDGGVYRQGFTEADQEGRQWLENLMQSIGLQTRRDGAANVIGRFGDPDLEKPAILIASHIDSVPCAGIFDGTLGVIAGLECIRVIKENDIPIHHPIEIIATSEEEGRFGGMLGAQALSGKLTIDWIEKAEDANKEKLRDAMEHFGYNAFDALSARKDPDTIHSYIELHIEQGPSWITRKNIGIVEGISGVFKWMVRLIGKADHAGTAPMNMRSDAFMGLADFGHEIQRIIDEEGTDKSRLTVGRIDLKPGFAHTIPGEVDFTLVGRDMDTEIMKNLASSCHKVLSAIARRHRLRFDYEERSWLTSSCDPRMIGLIEEASKELNYSYIHMPSGAGHDAQFFCDLVPTGMIFVPSVNGISHAPDEWTHWKDVEKGSQVLLNTLLKLQSSPENILKAKSGL